MAKKQLYRHRLSSDQMNISTFTIDEDDPERTIDFDRFEGEEKDRQRELVMQKESLAMLNSFYDTLSPGEVDLNTVVYEAVMMSLFNQL